MTANPNNVLYGKFLIAPDQEAHGNLELTGADDSNLSLFDVRLPHAYVTFSPTIIGTLYDQRKVTLTSNFQPTCKPTGISTHLNPS
ncbi:hypothetical protein [Mesorhizobium sp. WSM3866]|uniref:hypothetical protein n=1 Tax=Mesorhizobium sp. WSM3866 TaxID=422271 RepID=UPI001140E9DC|nr:hypothetical protein [Mesorhizobium sp. WSM3866]